MKQILTFALFGAMILASCDNTPTQSTNNQTDSTTVQVDTCKADGISKDSCCTK